jgi:DNA-directed RNA polymerase subunit L
MEWDDNKIVIKDQCHTLGNILQKTLCENKLVTFVSYQKKNTDIELFFTTKNNCMEEKQKILKDSITQINKEIDALTKSFQKEVKKN